MAKMVMNAYESKIGRMASVPDKQKVFQTKEVWFEGGGVNGAEILIRFFLKKSCDNREILRLHYGFRPVVGHSTYVRLRFRSGWQGFFRRGTGIFIFPSNQVLSNPPEQNVVQKMELREYRISNTEYTSASEKYRRGNTINRVLHGVLCPGTWRWFNNGLKYFEGSLREIWKTHILHWVLLCLDAK